MNKVTQTTHTSQALNNEITLDLWAFLNSQPKYVLKIFFKIATLKKYYVSLYASQARLGLLTGYCRQTVNEAIGILHDAGLIDKHYRHAKTCEYSIPTYMNNKETRIILSKFSNYFMAFALSFLCSKPSVAAHTTQLYKNKITSASAQTKRYTTGRRRQEGIDEAMLFASFYLKNKQQHPSVQSVPPLETMVPVVTFKKRDTNIERVNPMTTDIIFNEAQMEEISHHTQASYDYALGIYNKDRSNGKTIHNPASYFMTVFRSHVLKQQQPKTGTSKPTFKQAAQVQEQEIDPVVRNNELADRNERIKAKAISMGFEPSEYTIGQLQLLIKGYDVVRTSSVKRELKAAEEVFVPIVWNDMMFESHNTVNPINSNEPELGADEFAIDFDEISELQ